MPPEQKKAVILLSGGLDSTTLLAIAKNQGFQIYALSFDYQQRHSIEINAAKRVVAFFDVAKHFIVPLSLRIFGGSALTDSIDVPKNRRESFQDNSGDIPVTYVPARNTIFLSFALALAEVIESQDIFLGANAVDYSGYPDCRPEFIEAFTKVANLGTKMAIMGKNITIHAPLIKMTKAEIIKTGLALQVDYSITHSCYDPIDNLACGSCDSCLIRKKGFLEAKIPDPIHYYQ